MRRNQRLFLVYKMVDDSLYAAISTVPEDDLQEGETIPLEWSFPYIVSKQIGDQEIVYGSVIHLMYEAARPILRMNRLLEDLAENLPEDVRSSMVVSNSQDATTYTMPPRVSSASLFHKQEEIMKDALLLSGLHLRTLLETFSGQRNTRVPLYDYEGNSMGLVSFAEIFNTAMHYRYCVISGEYVHDIFSRSYQLNSPRLVGSKIKMADLFGAMLRSISSIRVNDFLGMLRGTLQGLNVNSESREIIFAFQNVHSLSQIISDRILDARFQGFQKFLFGELTEDEKLRIKESAGKVEIKLERRFGNPRFKIGADLGAETIEMHLNINGKQEHFEFGQEEFFKELSHTFGVDPIFTLDQLVEQFDKFEEV